MRGGLFIFALIISIGILALLFLVSSKKSAVNKTKSMGVIQFVVEKFRKVVFDIRSEIGKLIAPFFISKAILLTLLSISGVMLFYMSVLRGMDIRLTFFQTVFVSSIVLLTLIMPIKSFGGFGTTEGAWAIGMMVLGFSKEISIRSGFVIHLFNLINVIVLFICGTVLRSRLTNHALVSVNKELDKN